MNEYLTKPMPEPALLNIQVELSGLCNGRCLMCVNPQATRSLGHMPLAVLRKILDEAKTIKTLTEPVAMCGLGEPLVHPEVTKAFEICATSGVPWGLGTNCSRLTPEVADALAEARPGKVVLSFDAMTQDVMTKIRPGLNQGDVLRNILYYLNRVGSKQGWTGQTWVQMINFPCNAHQIVDFLRMFVPIMRDIPGGIIYVKQACWMPRSKMGRDVYPSQPIDCLPEEFKPRSEKPKIIIDDPGHDWATRLIHGSPCPLPWGYALIRWDGEYSPCCVDIDCTHGIGDIVRHGGIMATLHSVKMRQLRESLWQQKFGLDRNLCTECE